MHGRLADHKFVNESPLCEFNCSESMKVPTETASSLFNTLLKSVGKIRGSQRSTGLNIQTA